MSVKQFWAVGGTVIAVVTAISLFLVFVARTSYATGTLTEGAARRIDALEHKTDVCESERARLKQTLSDLRVTQAEIRGDVKVLLSRIPE